MATSAPGVPSGALSQRRDRLAHGLILTAGALCFLLLAWGHLGLGALLFPSPASAAREVASAGPLRVTLALDSSQLTAAGPNAVHFTITDAAGHAVSDATVMARPVMRTMAMDAPSVAATPDARGGYLAHPRFAMAGEWRLVVTVAQPGQPTRSTSFDVSVRW